MVKMMTMEEAAKMAGKTMDDFYDWIEGLDERETITDYVLKIDREQQEISCVYTDGSGGVLVLTGYGEYLAEGGANLYPIEGLRRCEIDFVSFSEIMRDMHWYLSLWEDLEEEDDEEAAWLQQKEVTQ